MLQYIHLLSDFSFRFKAFMRTFRYKNARMQNMPNIVSTIGI